MKKYLFSGLILVNYIFRFLTGNLYGVFLLLCGIYFFVPLISEIEFLSFFELTLLFDSSSDEFKALAISSLLTVSGFLIAFQTATKNWKDQLQANLRLDASREIDYTYNRATHLINQIKIYADQFIDLGDEIIKNGLTEETYFRVNYQCQQGPKFLQDRSDLSELNIGVSAMYGRYMNLLLASGNSFKNLHKSNKYLKMVTDKMWILIPNVDLKSETLADDFIRYFDREKLESLSIQCKLSAQIVGGLTGSVKGQLNSKVFEFNLRFVYSFLRFAPFFFEMNEMVKKGEIISDELFSKFENKI